MSSFEMPLFQRLEIDTQSHCNRTCWFCARTHDRSGVYLDEAGKPVFHQMPTGKIVEILDQAQSMGFNGLVSFHFYSEPLIDKRNIYFARETRKRGMKPILHTNGDVLESNSELCEIISEIYEYVVIGIYDYQTDEELESCKDDWRNKLPGADLKFSTVGDCDAGAAKTMGIPRALVPTDQRFAVPDITFANAPCNRPLIRLILRYDGEMCFCCEDMNAEYGLGNIFTSTLKELWYSDKHIEIVGDLLSGHREKYSLCGNCPLSPTAPAPPGQRMRFNKRNYVLAKD